MWISLIFFAIFITSWFLLSFLIWFVYDKVLFWQLDSERSLTLDIFVYSHNIDRLGVNTHAQGLSRLDFDSTRDI